MQNVKNYIIGTIITLGAAVLYEKYVYIHIYIKCSVYKSVCFLYKNRVVATATNLDKKTHPLQAKLAERVGLHQKIYLHSEIAALVKCREECDTIIVARVNSQNKLRNAKPCPICSMALKEAGIPQ